MPYKTMSIRIDKKKYDFVKNLAKEEKGDLSSAVRDLIDRGRVHLAIEEYKKGLEAEKADLEQEMNKIEARIKELKTRIEQGREQ